MSHPVRIVLDIDDTTHEKLWEDLENLDHIFNQWALQQNRVYKTSGLVYRNDNKTRARKYTNIALSISQIINLLWDFESIDAGIYNKCKLRVPLSNKYDETNKTIVVNFYPIPIDWNLSHCII